MFLQFISVQKRSIHIQDVKLNNINEKNKYSTNYLIDKAFELSVLIPQTHIPFKNLLHILLAAINIKRFFPNPLHAFNKQTYRHKSY